MTQAGPPTETRTATRPGAIERAEQVRTAARAGVPKPTYERQQEWVKIIAEQAIDDALDEQIENPA